MGLLRVVHRPSVLMVKLPRVVFLDYGLSRLYVGTIHQLLHVINLQFVVSSVLHKVSTACSSITSLARKPITNCTFQYDISEVVY